MIVPASGHQVRCIPWVQMDTFNKEIGFLRELNCIKCIEYILWGIPTTKSTFDVANMMKTATVKDVPFMWNSCLGKWYMLPYLVVPLISAWVPLISTRVSSHCQAILLHHHPSPYPRPWYPKMATTRTSVTCHKPILTLTDTCCRLVSTTSDDL